MRLTLFVSGLYLLFACAGLSPVSKSSTSCLSNDLAGQKFLDLKKQSEAGLPEPHRGLSDIPEPLTVSIDPEIRISAAYSRVYTRSDRGPPPTPECPAVTMMRHHKEEVLS